MSNETEHEVSDIIMILAALLIGCNIKKVLIPTNVLQQVGYHTLRIQELTEGVELELFTFEEYREMNEQETDVQDAGL